MSSCSASCLSELLPGDRSRERGYVCSFDAIEEQSILGSMPSRHLTCLSEANFPQFTMVRQNPRSLISYTSAQAHTSLKASEQKSLLG